MSNSPTATAACWSSLASSRCLLLNMLLKMCIKLLNAITTCLYRYKEIIP